MGEKLLLETEKLCQVTSQVTGQKQVLSYLQVVNSEVLAARQGYGLPLTGGFKTLLNSEVFEPGK